MNIDREAASLGYIAKEEMIMIRKDEYKDLLITHGKYEELKKINDLLLSLFSPNEVKNVIKIPKIHIPDFEKK